VELKRKKLRLVGSVLIGERGDLGDDRGVDWFDPDVEGAEDLFKRRYERLDDDSGDVDGGDR
jgi:hypothetical protein